MRAAPHARSNDAAVMPRRLTPLRQIGRRLRSTAASTVYFYLFGLMTVLVWFIPHGISYVADNGFVAWSKDFLAPIVLTACMALAWQQVVSSSGVELARRPWRFLAAFLAATVSAFGIAWACSGLSEAQLVNGPYALIRFFRYGFFFAPLGWLSCLYQQRAANMAKLTQLSLKRSVLSRELAQSRLLAARAQIDPGTVVRVLAAIRERYRGDPDAASRLMDHLIGYLRLAMNRVRHKTPSWSDEIAMTKEYLALCEDEAGLEIELHINLPRGGMPAERPFPLFLTLKKVFDTAASASIRKAKLFVDVADALLRIRLNIEAARSPYENIEVLRNRLQRAFPYARDIHHDITATGEHCHVFEISVECLDGYSPDC